MKFLVCIFILISAVFAEESAKAKRDSLLGDHSVDDFWSSDNHLDFKQSDGHDKLDGYIYHITLHKKVHVPIPHPVPVPVEKKIPYPVKVPIPYKVDKPYPVHVPAPYPVKIDKPYPVKVEKVVKVPFKVEVPVKVPVKVPYAIPKPYPVHVHKLVPVHIPEINIIKKPYPVYIEEHKSHHENSLGFDNHQSDSFSEDSLSARTNYGQY